VRKSPHAVLLLDEIEKAHPDLFAILLQVMDHATLTDTHGRHADFRHVILIMTTNAGARDLSGRKMGFKEIAQDSKATGVLERVFAPEFRNRLDAIVHFTALGTREIELVVDKHIDELRTLVAGRKITIELTPAARTWLAIRGFDRAFGARPMGPAGRENDQETALGFVTLRHCQRRRPRSRGRARGRHQGDPGMKLRAILLGVVVLLLVPGSGFAQVLQMMPVFEARCAQCHGGNAAERRAPDRNAIAAMTPERILEALTSGSMATNATGFPTARNARSQSYCPGGRSAAPRRDRPRP
jgi:hypothetical protein